MQLPFFIARRYLFGKKSRNVINYISAISVVVVAIVTMALFVVLSVFNGLQGLVQDMYNSFDPDIKITPTSGKVFIPNTSFEKIKQIPGVISYTEALEEDVLLKYGNKQFIGRIKGVTDSYSKTTGIDNHIMYGTYNVGTASLPLCIVGQGLSYYLSISINQTEPIIIYAPDRLAGIMSSPDKAYRTASMLPVGIFQTQQDIDARFIITNIDYAKQLLNYSNQISQIELCVDENKIDDIQKQISSILGESFHVKTREQQHEFVFKVLKSEKWGVFLIVSFILLIASFNIVGSLSMLIIDKKKDILILKSMGADTSLIKKIFLFEGWMISILGAIIGLTLGFILCWLQDNYGFLRFAQSGNFIIDAYPVKIMISDILNVLLVVLLIGFIAAYIPVRQLSKS